MTRTWEKKWIQISKLNCINISWAHKLYSITVCPEFMMFYLMFRSHFVASLFLFSPSLIPYKNNSCNCQASAALFIKVNIYYIFVWFFFGYFVVGSLLFSLMSLGHCLAFCLYCDWHIEFSSKRPPISLQAHVAYTQRAWYRTHGALRSEHSIHRTAEI